MIGNDEKANEIEQRFDGRASKLIGVRRRPWLVERKNSIDMIHLEEILLTFPSSEILLRQ